MGSPSSSDLQRPTGHTRPVAWNGVFLDIPSQWDFLTIGDNHLVFQDTAGPVFEIKWQQAGKSPTPEKTLNRLVERFGRRSGGGIRPWSPPGSWLDALSGFRTTGFAWSDGPSGGKGVAMVCDRCGRAALLQFFGRPGRGHAREVVGVMETFRDHTDASTIPWSVFDIRAGLPAEFRLRDHRFQPGAYTLGFAAPGKTLSLYRWAPASVLLKGRDLAGFAATGFAPDGRTAADPVRISGCSGLAWQHGPEAGIAGRIRRLIANRRPYDWSRIWHETSQNRILGFRLTSDTAADARLADTIGREFRSV